MNFFKKIADTFREQGAMAQLIIINIAVFLVLNIAIHVAQSGTLLAWLTLPVKPDTFITKLWTLFTYMFTHVGLLHLFWNMFTLYLFCQVFFILFGDRKLRYVYVMSGLSGGALLLIMGMIFPKSFESAYLLGASAAVMGIGAMMAVYTPDHRVYVFGMLEVRFKYYFLILFALTSVVNLSENTGGKIAHIGGAAFGFFYGYYLRSGSDLLNFSFLRRRNKSPLKVVSRNPSPEPSGGAGSDEQRMNTLLDKISKSGYSSLTKAEKDELFRLSQKK